MADDKLAAAVEKIRGDILKAEEAGMGRDLDRVIYTHGLMTGTSRRLLGVVDAVLEYHRPRQLYGLAVSMHGKSLCGHGEDYDGDAHFEGDDGLWYCRDKPAMKVCTTCSDGPDGDLWAEWPCPTFSDITRKLLGGTADA